MITITTGDFFIKLEACVFVWGENFHKNTDWDSEYAWLAIQTNFALDKYEMNPI